LDGVEGKMSKTELENENGFLVYGVEVVAVDKDIVDVKSEVFIMISIENLHLTIEGKEILKGIGLHLKAGDIYGLLGPNGAGKSTTIFALLGLRAHESGRIRVLGRDPGEHAAAIRSSVGVMPENAGFYNWMTAPAYLQWYSRLYGEKQTARDLGILLEKVGLGTEGYRTIRTYSRGMKQRLAVARALLPHPRLLILDEPTNGLDPKGRREIHDLLLEFAADGNAGVLLCTHLLDDVDRLCNRIGIIDQGHTRLEGRLGDLLAEQGAGQHYRLRVEAEPETANLPAGLSLLAHEGDWWRVQVKPKTSGGPSALWGELWQRGWRILEIRSEASSLEELYLRSTAPAHSHVQEVKR
jgi:ABC-2 type transport system ATP-binding protein